MENVIKFWQTASSEKVRYQVGLCLFFVLAAIPLSLWANYGLGEGFRSGMNKDELAYVFNSIELRAGYNLLTSLILVLFFTAILISIPTIRKSLRIQDIVFAKLEMQENQKGERIRQLEELNGFFRDLYDQAPVGLLTFDPDGLITEVNHTELNWLGYTREEVVGKKKFWELCSSSYTEGKLTGTDALKELGKFDNFETNQITKSGELIPVLINAKAIYNADGEFENSRTVIFNFTERKKMEALIQHKQQEADRLGLLKSQFIANVSHEIRTPLNAIIGFTQVLRHTYLSGKQAEFVNSIITSSENLLAIVNDILDFSRLEAGVFRLERVPFNLQELMLSVEQTFRFRAQEKELSFIVETAGDLPKMVCGDPTRLTQILNNLIHNAIKFTEQGFVRVKVEADRRESDRIYLRFLVTDSGIGIPEQQLERIFDRFGQVDSKTTRKFGGTGLGLTISQQLAESQDGKITVRSTLGEGTTFALRIPYRIIENGDKAKRRLENYTNDPLPKARVLIVEDNLLNARILELLLDQWGIEYACAKNGLDALEMLRNKDFDLVLMDIQMPKMDGYTAAVKIREELNLQLPIIALTAHAFTNERERCLAHGMNDYLAKPIHEHELRHLIHRYLVPVETLGAFDAIPGLSDYRPDFDPSIVMQVSRGNAARLEEMVSVFLQQTKLEIQGLETALKTNDHLQVARIAHSIKSTVSYMGFETFLNTELQELEKLALQQEVSLETVKEKWMPIRAKLDQARTFIKRSLPIE